MTEERSNYSKKSYLLIDCGSTYTTVVLFDIVEGAHRFVGVGKALTTDRDPWFDISFGIQHAIVQLEEKLSRPLLTDEGALIKPAQKDGSGIDHLGISLSVADPLKVIIFGLLDTISLATAKWACQAIYTKQVAQFSLKEADKEQAQADAILEYKPDVLFLAGGTNGNPQRRMMRLISSVSLGLSMLPHDQPPYLIYAGNKSLRGYVTEQLGDVSNLAIAENVRPELDIAEPYHAIQILNQLYRDKKLQQVPGLNKLSEWIDLPIQPTADVLTTMLEYLARHYQSRIYMIDLGSNSCIFGVADTESVQVSIATDLGMGEPLVDLEKKVSLIEVAKWLPYEIKPSQLKNYLYNKTLYPYTVPETEAELHLEQAIARVVLESAINEAKGNWGWDAEQIMPPGQMILVRGQTLSRAPRAGQTVLMVLDALQLTGIFSMIVDPSGILPALGVIAQQDPSAAVDVLNGGALVDLAWVVVPTGEAKTDQPILVVELESELGGKLKIEVDYGSLEEVPLRLGEEAELTLIPARGIDIGFGPGKGHQVKIYGGGLGLVIDARGRPLMLPSETEMRHTMLDQWRWDLGG